jgi:hypothetical protein
MRKTEKTSVRIVGVPADILIEHFPHTSQKHRCLASLLGGIALLLDQWTKSAWEVSCPWVQEVFYFKPHG